MINTGNGVSQESLAKFCRKHHIRRLAVAPRTVIAGNGEGPLEIIVEFDPAAHVGLLELVESERGLTRLFRRKVRLISDGSEVADRIAKNFKKLTDLYVAAS
jgi:predicted nucleotidyltransferase